VRTDLTIVPMRTTGLVLMILLSVIPASLS